MSASPVHRIPLDLKLRRLTVERVEDLGASHRRVVLAGRDLAGFEAHGPTDHAKIFFPPEPGGALELPDLAATRWNDRQDERYVVRDFTVRTHVPSSDELFFDMAVHAHGPAGRWAAQATEGQEVGVYGPKTSKVPPMDRRWYVLAADETGLPAVCNWLERLPTGPRVQAFVEVGGSQDELEIRTPAGVTVTWLHRGDQPAGTTELLADAVRDAQFGRPDDGLGWFWAGAEATSVRALRTEAMSRGLTKQSLSMTGYWRRGVPNFDHKSPEGQA